MHRIRLLIPVLFVLLLALAGAATAQDRPESVTLVGTFQSALGCDEDWQPDCQTTALTYDEANALWTGSWKLPAGDYEYKVALNGSMDESYGAHAEPDGAAIALSLAEETKVSFYYDAKTHWITDTVNSVFATVSSDFQEEIGCARDWQPDCLRTWLEDPDGDGTYSYSTPLIPAGDYKVRIIIDQSFAENYGQDGEKGGTPISFSVPDIGHEVVIDYNAASHQITISVSSEPVLTAEEIAAMQAEAAGAEMPEDLQTLIPEVEMTAPPESVTIAGTVQSVLGCSGDWQPECDKTFLTYDPEDGLWIGSWDIPAGRYEYKAALNASWEPENYGLNAVEHGPNIPLELAADTTVTFIYDHKTHWITDSVNSLIANVPGNFQAAIGCPDDWAPDCLRTWLQDPDGDGLYVYYTNTIPPGDWEAKVAIGQSWDENYGLDGQRDGPNIPFTVPAENHIVVVAYNTFDNSVAIDVSEEPVEGPLVMEPTTGAGNLARAQAYWVSEDTIAWQIDPAEAATVLLHYSPDAALSLEEDGVKGGKALVLNYNPSGLNRTILGKFPHLANLTAFEIAQDDLALVPEILKGQFAVSAADAEGTLLDATSLQIPGVLDDLYTYTGDLGVIYEGDVPTLKVWAPTAQSVRLHLFDSPDAEATVYDMELDPEVGVWSITGEPDWTYKFYLYEVQVYAPSTMQIETNLVTDPYSLSLSTNSTHSQIVDLLHDEALMPPGWQDMIKPPLDAPEDIVLYELHMRDFSVNDPSVPESLKGTFMAFTLPDSYGMQHLRDLAEAGLTHIHLLPVFDIATINENKSEWVQPDWETLAGYAPDSDQQQAAIEPIRDQDGFNWGYDPYHYTVPEGSYSTNPNGTTRILQFRRMVMGLNDIGLRLVLDVVYNHTNASGQDPKSVLDKIVPGYYHRLNKNGGVETSTCCQNTATEHNMMEKLMVDSLVMWARAYKVDGFRFDLMGHHMVRNMEHVRDALDALTLDADSVDGPEIYVYGEGWNFGEVLDGARGLNATQLNVGGLGIGTFNDRLRDRARGGSPFGDRQFQGFINGLYTDPNGITAGTEDEQKARLLHYADTIRVALAGNLRDYQFENAEGNIASGATIDYNGSPAGYTLDPQEQIAYVSAHDNETLFDKIQYAAPASATPDDRVRMQNMGISVVMLSQGVPFLHAGSDMLRSKSFDRNSYNSGDWFNKLDFTYQSDNWGVGLPPAMDNADMYDVMRPLLGNPAIAPGHDQIVQSVIHTQEMLKIRKSSKLFRLETADAIRQRLTFHNTGPDQIPGVIVMSISDQTDIDLDPNYELIVVIFNATPDTITFENGALAGLDLQLHPVQQVSADAAVKTSSFDPATGTLTVPARTTAVFVLAE
jgi:pullulanase